MHSVNTLFLKIGFLVVMSAIWVSFPCVSRGRDFMIGVKIYEYKGDYSSLLVSWERVGVNTVFLSADLASQPQLMAMARQHGITTYIILPVFQNPEKLAANPEY
ncbi:MAG TPA: hypothetical protein VE398_00170, partial [Acidobacteriota bacterium]|nr:hypothetical protein [Acidobacteriota bacterium]